MRRSHEIGEEHERLAVGCFQTPWIMLPPWLFTVRHALPEEDGRGIDIVAETDVGDIGLQVKSSTRFLDRHERRYPDVPVVVIRLGEAEVHVRKRILRTLKKIRKQRQSAGVDCGAMSEPQMCLACDIRPATSTGPVPLCSECEALAKQQNQRGVEFQKQPQEPEEKPQPAS